MIRFGKAWIVLCLFILRFMAMKGERLLTLTDDEDGDRSVRFSEVDADDEGFTDGMNYRGPVKISATPEKWSNGGQELTNEQFDPSEFEFDKPVHVKPTFASRMYREMNPQVMLPAELIFSKRNVTKSGHSLANFLSKSRLFPYFSYEHSISAKNTNYRCMPDEVMFCKNNRRTCVCLSKSIAPGTSYRENTDEISKQAKRLILLSRGSNKCNTPRKCRRNRSCSRYACRRKFMKN